MTTATVPAGPRIDERGRYESDLTCRQCGYNLRGLLPEDTCPECGLAVSESARSDLLSMARPRWLGTVRSGLDWMIGSIAAGVIFGVGMVVAGVVLSSSSVQPPMAMIRASIVLVWLVPGVIWLVGIFRFTRAETPGQWPESARAPARFARLLAVAVLAAGGVGVALRFSPDFLAQQVTAIGQTALSAGATVALLLYARTLARRVPSDRLVRHTWIVLWGLGIAMSLFLVTQTAQTVVFHQQIFSAPPTQANSLAAQAASGQQVAGGTSQGATTQPLPNGGSMETEVIDYPDGSQMQVMRQTDANGNVTQTSNMPLNVGFGGGAGVAMMVVQIASRLVGVVTLVFGIWELVLVFWYRRSLVTAERAAAAGDGFAVIT